MKLKDLEKKKVKLKDFKAYIQEKLPIDKYFLLDQNAITFNCLILINGLDVKPNKKSISEEAKKILGFFYTNIKDDWDFPQIFNLNILNLYEQPILYKHFIERTVREDLKDIDTLLNYYKTQPFIIDLLDNPKLVPRNHEQRVLNEFYNRSINKKNQIIEYLLNGLENRAIEKAKTEKRENNPSQKNFDELYSKHILSMDFPYRDMVFDYNRPFLDYKIDFTLLDWRRIDLIINKSFFLGIKCDHSKGYSREFFREINKINSRIIFKEVLRNIRDIPIIDSRHRMFKELKSLFFQNKWYGFYALAIPQIEGIFSEMGKISSPKKYSSGSLTDKVRAIRSFYEYSKKIFDYYEYYLPVQRNQFAHSGNIDDVKRKCKILLLDLHSLIKIFSELDTPLIRLKNILRQGMEFFTDVGRIAKYLSLVNQVKRDNLYYSISSKCDGFFFDELLTSLDFSSLLDYLKNDFRASFKKYSESILMLTSIFNHDPVDIKNINRGGFTNKYQDALQKIHNEHDILFREELKLLIDCNYVANNLEKAFDLPNYATAALIQFKNELKDEIKVVRFIDAHLKADVPEDFLLTKGKWQHENVFKEKR